MLFTLRRPKSERYFQLRFHGFGYQGKNIFEKILNTISDFLKSLYIYLIKRFFDLILIPGKLVLEGQKWLKKFKTFLVQKLIWSRGKLGRPIATSFVMTSAFFVFIIGKILNSSPIVNSQELDKDYLAYTSDIIPQRNSATTVLPEDRKRNEPFEYIVESGDTLSGIGSKFKVSTDALKYVNSLNEGSVLSVGQKIVIPPISGLVHKVERGDTLRSIALKYDVPSQAIADFNYILDTSKLAVGTELVIPGAKVPQIVVPAAPIPAGLAQGPSTDPNARRGWCIWPTSVRYVSQGFSWYHNGVDIATPDLVNMPPLYACSGGVVSRAGWDPWGLGLHVRIKHSNGYETIYGHMSRLDVTFGEEVKRGEVIGLMGNTGRSTGPHTHFMVLFNGKAQNPLDYIN